MKSYRSSRIACRCLCRCQTAALIAALELVTAPFSRSLLAQAADTSALPAATNLVRIGIAPGTWWGMNRNDANAAITAWARTITRHRGIHVDVRTRIFDTPEELFRAIRGNEVDAVSMLSDQFVALDSDLQADAIFVSTRNRDYTEQYVLLTRQDGALRSVTDLPGHTLTLQSSARTSLATYWLDTLLATHSLGPAEGVVKELTRTVNASKAVLQVYFRQADACVVTTNVFSLACELNPQLAKELRVLAISPPVVPSLFFFQPRYTSPVRASLEPAIVALEQTPAGQQVLTVFQGDGMLRLPSSCLEETRKLLLAYHRVCLAHTPK